MSKQVLSVEQMQYLKESGLKFKPTMLCYVRGRLLEDEKWDLTTLKDLPRGMFEQIPAYTLQDILDLLPKYIDEELYRLEIGIVGKEDWYIVYARSNKAKYYEHKENLIDVAYDLLCWAIENGYVETNKEG